MNQLFELIESAKLNSAYAGLGPASTPLEIQIIFSQIAEILGARGFILRSGGEEGGDSAFERGSILKEVFLPYQRFNSHPSERYSLDERCFDVIKRMHPAWHRCSEYLKKSHARHVYELLGDSLESPACFLVCWTPDGATNHEDVSGKTGLLRTAIALAGLRGIPTINAGRADHLVLLRQAIDLLKKPVDVPREYVVAEPKVAVRRKGFRTLHPEDY